MGSAGVVVLCLVAVWFSKGCSLPFGDKGPTNDDRGTTEFLTEDSVKDALRVINKLESQLDHDVNSQLKDGFGSGDGGSGDGGSGDFDKTPGIVCSKGSCKRRES